MWTIIGFIALVGLLAWISDNGGKIIEVLFYIVALPLMIPLFIILFVKNMIDWYKESQASKSSSVE
jgi:ABC-type transport system involved in cytochrome bd biosynthesis fused ATPase/permease subunit